MRKQLYPALFGFIVLLFPTLLVAQAPTITSFNPSNGPVGTTVTINGTGFSSPLATNTVYFGATRATLSSGSSTQLIVSVPSGATNQPILVVSKGFLTYSSKSFTPTFGSGGYINATSFETKIDFAAGSQPSSVAIGDLDNDGKADLIVANEDDDNISVFLNTGSANTVSYANGVTFSTGTGSGPKAVAIGDLDNDGKLDVAVANNGSNNVSVFKNTSISAGTISLATKQDFNCGQDPYSITVNDLDGDGKADLAMANYSEGISVLHNASAGVGFLGFDTYQSFLINGVSPTSIANGDFDDDGKPDLVTANIGSADVSVILNTSTVGTINFSSSTEFVTGSLPITVSVGDVDNDGKSDLAVANNSSNTISVLRNTSVSAGSVSFAGKVDFATATTPRSVTLADLDGDGKADLTVTNWASTSVSLLRNTSTGAGSVSYASKVDFTTGSQPSSVFAGDLDGDGALDLAVANYLGGDVSVLRNAMFVAVPTISSFSPAYGPVNSSVTITGTNFSTAPGNNIVWFGATQATVTSATETELAVDVPYGATHKPITVTVNGYTAYSKKPFIVDFSGGTAFAANSFLENTIAGTGSTPNSLVIGDIDTDGKPDMIAANRFGNSVSIIRNNTIAPNFIAFDTKIDLSTGTGISTRYATIGDLDGDGKPDVIAANGVVDNVSIFRNTSTGGLVSFDTRQDFPGGLTPNWIATADFDNDGRTDFAVTNSDGLNVSVFRNTSTGPGTIDVDTKVDFPIGSSAPIMVATGDMDNDGRIDLVFINQNDTDVKVMRNLSTPGNPAFDSYVGFTGTFSQATSIVVSDLDNDDLPDVALVNVMENKMVVLHNISSGPGSIDLISDIDLSTSVEPLAIAVDDLNGDGGVDLAVVNDDSGPTTISIFENISPGAGTILFGNRTEVEIDETSSSSAIADFDADGKPDIAVLRQSSNAINVYRNTMGTPPKTVLTQDSLALVAMYNNMDGVNWNNKTNWLTGPVDTWYGITVDEYRVSALNLNNNGLLYALPTELGDLNGLESLILNNNGIEGSIPTEIGNLDDLVYLNFNNNYLTGNIPSSLFDLTQMTDLNLSFNALEGDIPTEITGMINMNYLSLNNNLLTGLPDMSVMTWLTSFDVAYNIFTFEDIEPNLLVGGFNYQPQNAIPSAGNQSLSLGDNLTLNYVIGGSANRYQWIKDGVPIAGEESDTYSKSGVDITDAGDYVLEITSDVVSGLTLSTLQLHVTILGAGPQITSVSPESGAVGSAVVINGVNFDPVPKNNNVFFGAARAPVNITSTTQLTVSVPAGATYQPITVAVNGKVAYASKPFVVTFNGTPNIDLVSYGNQLGDIVGSVVPYAVAMGDFEGDGKVDLVTANHDDNTLTLYQNTSSVGTISYTSLGQIPAGDDSKPLAVVVGDLDGDGRPDLAIANYNSNNVTVIRNISTPGAISFDHANKVDFSTGAGSTPRGVVIGDLDGDGKSELATVNYTNGTVSVFKNTSTGPGSINFATKVDFATGSGAFAIAIGDLNADGQPDLAVTNFFGTSVSVFRNRYLDNGVLSFDSKQDFVTGSSPNGISIGDIDGDNNGDIVVANQNSNSVSVLRYTGSAGSIAFAPKADFTVGTEPSFITIADLNGDGKVDLAVTNQSSKTISLLKNTSTSGSPGFAAKVDLTTSLIPSAISIGDIEGDGRPDLAVVSSEGTGDLFFFQNSMPNNFYVSGFTPSSGPVGTQVILHGNKFDLTPANNVVTFNGTPAVVTAGTISSLTTSVPAGATTGPIHVQNGPDGVDTDPFTVVPAKTIITSDSLALVALYNSTNGAGWTNKTNWLTGPANTWNGLTVTGDRVTQLILVTNNLTGSLPNEIGNLTALTQINLAQNALSGPIPTSIGNITSLQFLRLYQNSLTGPVPSSIGNLTSLKVLTIFNNQLSGDLPAELWTISSITNIYASDNQFTGTIPASIGSLTQLFQLILSNNKFTGTIPQEIGNLTGLTTNLALDGNQFTGTLPSTLNNLTTLARLSVNNNQFSGAVPALNNLAALEILNLSNNGFTDLPDLSGLTSLTSALLNNNLFTFEDIQPNAGIAGVVYSPQGRLSSSAPQLLAIGQSATFTKAVGGTGNVYQWKNGTTNITGATSNTYAIASVTPSNNGSYNLTITNPAVPGLTLQTDDFLLTITSSLVAEEAGYQFYKKLGFAAQGAVQIGSGRDVTFDSNGNLFVLDGSGQNIKKFDGAGNLVSTISGPGTNDGRISIAFSIAFDASDNLYVLDYSLARVQVFDTNGNFIRKWGTVGTGNSQFNLPRGIAVNKTLGLVYVADTNNNKIKVFDLLGNFQFSFGTAGSGNGQFLNPYKIFVSSSGQLLVSDRLNNRVQVFTSSGTYVSQFGGAGSGDGQLSTPTEIAEAGNGDFLVCDQGNARIQRFNSSGAFVSKFGVNGISQGQFQFVESIVIAANGDIIIGDIGNGVQRFSGAGVFISILGNFGNGPGFFKQVFTMAMDSKGNRYVVEAYNARVQKLDKKGNFIGFIGSYGMADGQFNSPRGIAIDRSDNIYVSDIFQNRIQKFTSAGVFISSFGSSGTGDGQFNAPIALSYNRKTNTIWVAESGGARVQQFKTDGTFVSKFGSSGTGQGQFSSANSIVTDKDGNVIVSDFNFRIQKFKSDGTFLTNITTTTGVTAGQLNGPRATGTDFLGNIYEADYTGQRIQKFDPDFSLITKFGDLGTGNGDEFNAPNFVLSNPAGDTLWVSELNNQIQIWTARFKKANSSDSLALVSLYNSLGGPSWTHKNNWLTGNMNTWYGVTASAGRVRGLNLSANNLTGSVPSTIEDLSQLITLNLQSNQIDELPEELGNLIHLQYLNVSSNVIKGDFPTSLSALSNLNIVKASNNEFTGSVVVPSSAYVIDLKSNKLSTLPNLAASVDSLSVQNNQFDFADLEPNASIPAFSYSPQDSVELKQSVIREVGARDSIMSVIGGLNTTYKWFKNNVEVSGVSVDKFKFQTIAISDDATYRYEATNTLLPGITLYRRPYEFRVSSIYRDSIALVALYNSSGGANWTNKANWLTTPLRSGNWFGVTIVNNRVSALSLPNNNLTGSVPQIVADVLNLTSLNLSGNKIQHLPDLKALAALGVLNVSNNRLDFASLIPNSTITGVNYQNQADIGVASRELIDYGTDYKLSVFTKGEGNQYQWKRNGVNVEGAIDSTYTIASIGRINMGEYFSEITNPAVPNLKLKTATKQVLATATLSGRFLVSDNVGASKGKIRLLLIRPTNGYDTIEVKDFNEDGSFKFEKVVLDNYQISGFADTLTYARALPSYYKSTFLWEQADTLFVNSNMNDLDIFSIFKPGDVKKGVGVISGSFQEEVADGGRIEKPKRVSGAGASVRVVENAARPQDVRLTLVAYVFTNEQGEFEMPELPKGEYRLNIQYPGYPMDESTYTTMIIGDGLQSQIKVAARVEDNKIKVDKVVITGLWEQEGYEVIVYPNPTSDFVQFKFVERADSRIMKFHDASGRQLKEISAVEKEKMIELKDLTSGTYLIQVIDENKLRKTVRLVIERK